MKLGFHPNKKEKCEKRREKMYRSTYTGADQREHDTLVESQRFALFHFDAFLIQAFHGVHFASVGLPAAIDLTETAAANDSVNAEIVHSQLRHKKKGIESNIDHSISAQTQFTHTLLRDLLRIFQHL